MTERLENHLDDQTLYHFLDEELSPEADSAVRNHLAGCQRCQTRLQALSQLYMRLETLEDLPLGRDLSPAVLAGITQTQQRVMPAMWLLATQLLVVILVLGGSWSYLDRLATANIWSSASLEMVASFSSAATRLAQLWAAVQDIFARLSAWMQSLVQLAATSQVPPLPGWPWLVAATLLWVLVNGFLLQRGPFPQRNRDRRP